MEKINSSLAGSHWVEITHSSDIAAARRLGQRLAQQQDFDETRTGQLAIVITEAATNILKHAREGRMQLVAIAAGEARGIEVLAIDKGPGIANLSQALRDGVSSTGTAGTGLGALRRLSDEFDVYAAAGKGAVFFMRLWRNGLTSALPAGGVCLPLAGETESGDAWAFALGQAPLALMVADGLGHGPEAAKAAAAAVQTLAAQPQLRPAAQIEACHAALRPTRGAALASVLVDPAQRLLYFAGVGNIGACVIEQGARRQLVSHNGIVGHNMRKVQEFTVALAPGALVIMASDGISTQWDLGVYPGLAACAPSVIAAVLLRDCARARDDACVLVLRCPESA
ncbi:Anti-sigma regulatory factor (Ser/Thr protein kinase) [Duganella sacchari]|uniref:Anti-sigma regulatory factor (Ser/Thr protein kinase) n=1 Tax=Duganella sacchari TaxID=551987 RepID=A0A1M7R760_9BURK|nr:ATP-binding SpoIIE family protein phosphatase [Duganella sacchari]SHN41969.1 Anti-sigma regulatory factor (Ser/Thr protein kinase) [Duganella sacchari]